METQTKNQLKTLALIGGMPCLAVLLGFVLAFIIFPEDGFHGMILIGVFASMATFISIIFLLKNILNQFKDE